ncbi:MAG: hypothetical protein Fur0032_10020 [Terrimicrobiaceae bacterium]
MTADGFEEGDFTKWRLQTWGKENEGKIAEPPVKFEGNLAFRSVANQKAAAVGRDWCEIGRYFGRDGDTRWWGFAVLFPEDYKADGQNAVLCQMHSRSDKEMGEQSLAPEVVLRCVGERLMIEVRSDVGDLSEPGKWGIGGTVASELIYEGQIERGKWITWVFNVRMDFSGGGFVRVWRDGEQVADYDGPVGMNNAPVKSLRIGLYKKFYKDLPPDAEQVVWFDAFTIGDERASYETVNPNPSGTLPYGRLPDGYEGPLHSPQSTAEQ